MPITPACQPCAPSTIAASVLALVFQLSSLADDQPNIVLILADDLGWADTTLYGKTSLYETPNIEQLAARGMVFSSAYAKLGTGNGKG